MAFKKVDKYWLGYNRTRNLFLFYYRLEGENVVKQFFPSSQEFLALADMFRNEGQIHYNTNVNYFVTDPEDIGEGELVA